MSTESAHRFRYSLGIWALCFFPVIWLGVDDNKILLLLFYAIGIGGIVVFRRHHRNYSKCMVCLLHIGMNGEQEAQKRVPWLRIFHSPNTLLISIIGFLLWVFGVAFNDITAGKIMGICGASTMLFIEYVSHQHGLVQRWCRYCHPREHRQEQNNSQ